MVIAREKIDPQRSLWCTIYALCLLLAAYGDLSKCQLLVPRQGRSTESFLVQLSCNRRIATPHAGHHVIKSITNMGKEKKKREKVIVVGAGPVGSLAALYAAHRGNDVEVYELRGGKLRNNGQSFIVFSITLNGTCI